MGVFENEFGVQVADTFYKGIENDSLSLLFCLKENDIWPFFGFRNIGNILQGLPFKYNCLNLFSSIFSLLYNVQVKSYGPKEK